MKTKLQRWSCKKLIASVIAPLWDWVHAGDVQLRLRCFRTMGSDVGDVTLPSKSDGAESVDSMVTTCRVLIVEALMAYAQGTGSPQYKEYWKEEIAERLKKKGTPPKKYARVYPYGPKAAKTQDGFKAVPFTWFACTLGAMYPFLAVDQKVWSTILAEHAYPMTHLWPESHVRRAIHFVTTSKRYIEDVFDCYEESCGEYYGDCYDRVDDTDGGDDDKEEADEAEQDENATILSQVDSVF